MTEAELGVLIEAKLAAHARGARPEHASESSLGLSLRDPVPIESYCALLRILRRNWQRQRDELTDQQQELCLQWVVGL